MKKNSYLRRKIGLTAVWLAITALLLGVGAIWPGRWQLKAGITVFHAAALVSAIIAGAEGAALISCLILRRKQKPEVEGMMLGSLYRLVGIIGAVMAVAYGLGQLGAFGQFFTLFGGMILGWSLQAPVSGFAAWALVSIKRPFRPGDRVQFPGLGLTGDVEGVGLMYTVLNQVGGSISSEEAVGRHILVPNAMLFSQVAINYTVTQEAAYMLDEVVVRMTYDSDWKQAESILLDAARAVTRDVIDATGEQPYIRSDTYDYGVYLRLRYRTHVKTRAETSYEITKLIYNAIKHAPMVDLAIPFIYSARSGAERKRKMGPSEGDAGQVSEIPIDQIHYSGPLPDQLDIEQLVLSIDSLGLLQPVLVVKRAGEDGYDLVAGQLRYAACKQLGWRAIPSIVRVPAGEG